MSALFDIHYDIKHTQVRESNIGCCNNNKKHFRHIHMCQLYVAMCYRLMLLWRQDSTAYSDVTRDVYSSVDSFKKMTFETKLRLELSPIFAIVSFIPVPILLNGLRTLAGAMCDQRHFSLWLGYVSEGLARHIPMWLWPPQYTGTRS